MAGVNEETWRPSRTGIVVAGSLVVVTAVIAAPQFVLDPLELVAVLAAGGATGVLVTVLASYRRPSRTFLLLALPLVFVGIAAAPRAFGLPEPAILVGLSTLVLAGVLTDAMLTSR